MNRMFGILLAFAFTIATIVGIAVLIIVDLFGSDTLQKVWKSATAENTTLAEATALKNAKDITFFEETRPSGARFVISTGVSFTDVQTLARNEQERRWCYVMLTPKGGLPRQVTLANQRGRDAPVFNDLTGYPPEELRSLGVDAKTLQEIARKHCRFAPYEGAPEKPSIMARLRQWFGA